jgi:hypothetical protein
MKTNKTIKVTMLAVLALAMGVGGTLGAQQVASTPKQATVFNRFPTALGFQAGELSASGLSVQTWSGNIGLTLNAGGYMNLPTWGPFQGEHAADYNAALTLQFKVAEADFSNWFSSNLYIFMSVGHRGYVTQPNPVFHTSTSYDPYYSSDDYTQYAEPEWLPSKYVAIVHGGVGLGTEMVFARHFSIPIELGYGAFWDVFTNNIQVRLVPQIAARWRF